MADLILECRNVTLAYGPIRAIQDLSLELRVGEAIAVVGANGAGKTTLIRALSGLMQPAAGEIFFNGRSARGVKAHELAIGGMLHIPEGRGTLGSMSVLENLRVAYDIRPAAHSFEEAIARAFERFPRLGERRGQLASSMSGGEQQMLALSRAIVNPPRVLLVDEPSMGLSPLFVTEAFRVLREFRQMGMTMLVVEQNVRRALQLVDRGYVLRQGQVVMSGLANDLLTDRSLISSYLGAHAVH